MPTGVKSVIFDVADYHGGYYSMGVRSIEFLDPLGNVITMTDADGDFTADATTIYESSVHPKYVFDTSTSKTGTTDQTSWEADGKKSDQRILIVFSNPISFIGIVVNNYHASGEYYDGGYTDRGIKNTDIYWSENETTNTTYGADTGYYHSLGQYLIEEHVADDVIDNQYIYFEPIVVDVPASEVDVKDNAVYVTPVVVGVPVGRVHASPRSRDFTVIPIIIPSGRVREEAQQPTPGLDYLIPQQRVNLDPQEVRPEFSVSPPPALVSLSVPHPLPYWTADPTKVQTIYLFTLTGAPDGTTDVTIPISSCQMRRRDGDPTYMSVVVPGYDDWVGAITARPNGEMIFRKGVRFADGSQQVEEIARANLEDIRLDKGSKERSVTLVGHKTVSNTAPNVVTLSKASYRNVDASGLRRYRCEVDLWIRPGDTVEIEGESFTVGFISYIIGVRQEVMELVEMES